jgi:hypothetical protein
MKLNHITISEARPSLPPLKKFSVRILPLKIARCFPQRPMGRHRHGHDCVAVIRVMSWIDIKKLVDDKEESKCSNSINQTSMQVKYSG